MFTKNIVALTAFAALTEQALAFNSHRHLHRRYQADKRDVHVEWVTVWDTVYVDAPGPTQAAQSQAGPKSYPEQHAAEVEQPAVVPTPAPVVNEIKSVLKTPQYAPPPPAPPVPAAPETTLATYVKPPPQPAAPSYPPAAAAPASSYAPPPPAPSAGGAGGSTFSSKRGIAYNDVTLANSLSKQCEKCGWAYNWGSNPQNLDPRLSFVPTLWGPREQFTQNWDSDVQKALGKGAKALFSFNEPDNAGQCNLSPGQAASGHVQYMNKYGGKALIGSPSITNSGQAGQGIQWLKGFMDACNQQPEKCHVDFVNVHWYSPAEQEASLYDHLQKAHEVSGGKPVWLTEFAAVDAAGQPANTPQFLKSVMAKLDKIDYVHAYAPFMCADGKLMNGNSPSDTGMVLAGLA
ncbi:hypothetical protein HIM_05543 [Hirsutella minnesotensis 3608]|uniref:Asl1-like glycosyl hydrolase catalytic domain-containing protein n=1 Tax=Hirsutella minnesotensis 3608 TaxID=1043627 RepID=A0A0F8A044_9HYPO|nr:hypothetical protein HIM_05543 [Hirsutella minnesotensis 3608]